MNQLLNKTSIQLVTNKQGNIIGPIKGLRELL